MSSQTKPLVLNVDDDPDFRHLIETVLTNRGYGVMTAESGSSAFAALESARPDLILLDITMPEMASW